MKYLDLDEVQSSHEFTLRLNGNEHKLVEASVDTFIDNSRDLETLGVDATSIQELEITLKLIKRAFPTLKDDELRALTLSQLKAIHEYAQKAGGEVAEQVTEDELGNAPKANK